jgi:LPS export ABC transporter protein LptC
MVSSFYIRSLLALLVIVSIIGIAGVVFRKGSHGSASVQAVNQQLPHNIDVALKKARFSEIQDGLVAWDLVAERVDYDKGGDKAYLSVIRMEFKHTRSHGAITVTADSGEYLSSEKNVWLKGNVHVVTEDGAVFDTESIKYIGAKSLLSTGEQVSFHQQRLTLTATGMNLGVKDQKAYFYSMVDATINQ